MSRRTALLALVALALGGALLASRYLRPEAEPGRTAAPVVRFRSLEPPVAERLARIDARLRLPPDRRALAAVGEIRRLTRGSAAPAAEASYASGSWKIAHEGESVGMLSGFPRFSALLSLLDERAARERAKPGAVPLAPETAIRPEHQDRLNRFDDVAAFEVLAAVDASWRRRRASAGDLPARPNARAALRDPAARPAGRGSAGRAAFASLALARQYAPERTCAPRSRSRSRPVVTHGARRRAPARGRGAGGLRRSISPARAASRPSRTGHVDSSRRAWCRRGRSRSGSRGTRSCRASAPCERPSYPRRSRCRPRRRGASSPRSTPPCC
jgi:hypothetical protein